MKKYAVVTMLGLGWSLAGAATAQELPEPANKVIDYQKDIAPIFADRCIKCHGPEKQKSDYRLDTRDDAIKSGSEGAAIVEGNSADSLMVKLIAGLSEDFDLMPPKGDPLTAEQIGLIRAWIDQGAVWEGSAPSAAGAPVEMGPEKSPFPGLGEQWFVEATGQKGPLATWEVSAEKGPAGETCVALTKPNHTDAGTFNLLWDAKTAFKHGKITTKLKVVSGEEDQGGGLIWRAKDKNNYYIARVNPIEKDVRLYEVVDGTRKELAAADVEKPAGAWIVLDVEQQDNHIKVSLDGTVMLEADSATFADAGGVGLWTKADAATVFTQPSVAAN